MSKRVAIGIDLGTTNCCVGVFLNGRVQILENPMGSRMTPSCVAFDDQDVHIGEAAIQQLAVNAKNTIFEVKRLLGRRFDDPTVQDDIKQWPFEVLNDHDVPKIRVQHKKKQIVLAPEQVSAMLLQQMKAIAEKKLGTEVVDAVITVPAYFGDSQRQATIDAGKIAGLNVLSILNEPTSAAIAYGFGKNINNKNILVFDMGGGTFDVAVVSITGNCFEIKSVWGDTHLGGSDFDLQMSKAFQKIILQKFGIDLERNERARMRLRSACEKAKVSLSSAVHTRMSIDCLVDGKDFVVEVRRNRLEDVCSGLMARTIDHIRQVLDDASLEKNDIDDIVLVGGSSRILKLQEILSTFFDGKKLNCTINPDEAVAYGAALRAAMLSGESAVQKITLQDVVPLSLGMEGTGDRMVSFIRRNTLIPKTVVQPKWTTSEDFEEAVTVKVYEGEEKIASKNNLLGTFEFRHGEREKAGVPSLTFTFAIDANGILHVFGSNDKTKRQSGVAITGNKGRLSFGDIERLKKDTRLLTSASL